MLQVIQHKEEEKRESIPKTYRPITNTINKP